MRRPVTFLIWLLLVLGAVLLIAWWSPMMPSSAQAITPTVIEPVEPTATPGPLDGLLVRLYWQGLYQDFTCYPAGMAPTPTHDVVETPLPTALPPTATPTHTPLPSPTPTATSTLLPTCGGVTTADTLNGRDAPRGAITATFEKGTSVGIASGVWFNWQGTWELWYKATANGKSVYLISTYVQLNPGAQCHFPTKPTAIRTGPHILGGPGVEVVPSTAARLQAAKCIVDFSSSTCTALQRANPAIRVVLRTLTVDGGQWDCPQPWEYANADPSTWYARLKGHLPPGADAYEGQNECPPPPGGFRVWAEWSIRLAQLVNRDFQAPFLAFSFAPGNPDFAAWQDLLPYLEWVAANPLPDGRYNGVATHSSVYMTGAVRDGAIWVNNPWIAGREALIADYLMQAAGFDLRAWPGQWWLTETGLDDGYSGLWGTAWTCAEYRDAYQTSQRIWAEQGVVDAATWWNIGQLGQWTDDSACWSRMVQ